jgi:hypothetical protein
MRLKIAVSVVRSRPWAPFLNRFTNHGAGWRLTERRRRRSPLSGRCRDKRSIATLASSSPSQFFAGLFGPDVKSGYRPIRLPKLHIVVVDEPPGGFDSGLIINTIQSNHANSSVV